ncbi:SagB/ThcOx family dehydrogenase [bacterium]|nr:SagB/ThcOx family dehydrogenase [bacterium]
MENPSLEQYRQFLKENVRLTIDFSQTDQSKGLPPPPIEKPFPPDGKRIDLVAKHEWKQIAGVDLTSAINNRISHRRFRSQPLTLEELSFLLWATQGIRQRVNETTARRTVPSAGCRHALETYLCVLNVAELEPGIYRYLPLEHQLLFEFGEQELSDKIVTAALGQIFTGKAAVVFIWTAVPYRMEWRYDLAAHKAILLDAGHVCQNLYLACAAIDAGTCAIAAYHQELTDQLLRIDGQDEFTIYMAPVGKI